MANQTIKERLDGLKTSVNGMIYTTSMKEGWTISKSEAGLIVAELGTDKDVTLTSTTALANGMKNTTTTFTQVLPSNTFTKIMSVEVCCYSSDNLNWTARKSVVY